MSSGSADYELERTIDSVACLVYHYKDGFEEKLKENNRTNPDMSFLLSTDENHGLYQEKLAEYRAKDQDNDDVVIIHAPNTSPYVKDTFKVGVLDMPPEEPQGPIPEGITSKEYDTIKLISQFAAHYGLEFLGELKRRNDPRFDFLFLGTDKKYTLLLRLYGSYLRVIMNCWATPPPSMKLIVDTIIHLLQGDRLEGASVTALDSLAHIQLHPQLGEPDLVLCRDQHRGPFPKGITVREYGTMKLTAQFAVRYKKGFVEELKKRKDPQFDFVESGTNDEDKFLVFTGLCASYSHAIMPFHSRHLPSDLKPIVEAFIQFLPRENHESAFVSGADYFANIQLPQPDHLLEDQDPKSN